MTDGFELLQTCSASWWTIPCFPSTFVGVMIDCDWGSFTFTFIAIFSTYTTIGALFT